MVGRTARRLALQEHRAFDTRSLVMEARWMLETCMLAVVQSLPVRRCLKVVCKVARPTGSMKSLPFRILGVSDLGVAYQTQR
jgi:hypothetical protein